MLGDSHPWLPVLAGAALAGGTGFLLGRYHGQASPGHPSPESNECCKPDQKSLVSDAYASVVERDGSKSANAPNAVSSTKIGYSSEQAGAKGDLGLGCGTPVELAKLEKGERVLDLGCGAGFDAALAKKEVGEEGLVVGVDMTPEMLQKARENHPDLHFRLGEIEHLPAGDGTFDVVISNCVINLSPDKAGVFREAFRVLRKGGRLAVADVVATAELPDELRTEKALACCVAGARAPETVVEMLKAAGFTDVCVQRKEESREFIRDWMPGSHAEDYVVAANITATKPAISACR